MSDDPRIVGVLAVHGIGEQEPGWSHALRDAVAAQAEVPVAWGEVTWADVVHPFTAPVAERLKPHVQPTAARGLLVTHAADALAYARGGTVYAEAHARIGAGYFALVRRLPPETPIVLVAHSLGTVLVTDWLWDSGYRADGLVTMGSPIPLFVEGLERPMPPRPPRWLNLYDPLDPIGHPLRPLHQTYAAAVEADVRVHNQNWFERRIPGKRLVRAHCDYERNVVVQAYLADLVTDFGRGDALTTRYIGDEDPPTAGRDAEVRRVG